MASSSNQNGREAFKVAVESIIQRSIKEINYEGEETYEEKKTPSQLLTDQAHRVDFSGGQEEDEEDGMPAPKRRTPEKWPWEAVHSKLSQALTEVSVLSDLLQIAKHHRHYIALDPVVQQSSAAVEASPSYQIRAKKKALAEAADILSAGAKALVPSGAHGNHSAERKSGVSEDRYLSALVELRKRWKLRRSASGITVDISFASAGSTYMPPTSFEVIKGVGQPSSSEAGPSKVDRIAINLPKELRAQSEILIFLREHPVRTVGPLSSYILRLRYPRMGSLPHWEQQLYSAQSVLFNKELLTKLCYGMYHIKRLDLPFEMTENQLHIPLRKDKWISVINVIEYGDIADFKAEQMALNRQGNLKLPDIRPNWELLVRVKQALRDIQRSNASVPLPQPATATFDNPDLQYAGVNALTNIQIQSLQQGTNDPSKEVDHSAVKLFDDFIKHARHIDAVERVCQWVQEVVGELDGVSGGVQWQPDPTGMVSKGRILLQQGVGSGKGEMRVLGVTVESDVVSVQLGDGKPLTLQLVDEQVKQCIKELVVQYRLELAQKMAEGAGWRVLHLNQHAVATAVDRHLNTALIKPPVASIMLETTNAKLKLELFVTCSAAIVHLTGPSLTSPPTKGGASLVLDQKQGRCFTEQLTNTLSPLAQQYQ